MAKDRLRILTSNLACLPHQNEPALHRKRGRQILEAVQNSDIDVACFQEVFSDAAEEVLLGRGARQGYTATYDGIKSDILIADSGLVTLSSNAAMRLWQSKFIEYSDFTDFTWDALSDKGALINAYIINNDLFGFKYLWIVNTHTQSGSGNSNKGTRQKQLTQAVISLRYSLAVKFYYLANLTKNTISEIAAQTLVLFLGDLNVIGESEEYKNMMNYLSPAGGDQIVDLFRKRFPKDPGYTYDGTQNKSRSFDEDEKGNRERLDYILAYKSLYVPAFPNIAQGQVLQFHFPDKRGRDYPYNMTIARPKFAGTDEDISDHFGLLIELRKDLRPKFDGLETQLTVAEGTAVTHTIRLHIPDMADRTPLRIDLNKSRVLQSYDVNHVVEKEYIAITLNIKPGFTHAGMHAIYIRATSSDGYIERHPVFVTVTDVNAAPIINEIPDQNVYEGDRVSIPVSAFDLDEQPITLTLTQAPDFVKFENGGGNNGKLTVTPDFEDAGQYTVQMAATDPNGAVGTSEFGITVLNVNRSPLFQPVPKQTLGEGQTRSITISAADPDRQELKLNASSLPSFATFKHNGNGSGIVTLQPGYHDSGLHSATIHAVDPEGATEKVSFGIEVRNVLRPLPTKRTQKAAHGSGILELKVQNWRPNLALQVETRQRRRWQNVVNDNGDRAWFHETVGKDEIIRYGYGENAVGTTFRVVVYDKTEKMRHGWAVSDEFKLDEAGQQVIVTMTLP